MRSRNSDLEAGSNPERIIRSILAHANAVAMRRALIFCTSALRRIKAQGDNGLSLNPTAAILNLSLQRSQSPYRPVRKVGNVCYRVAVR